MSTPDLTLILGPQTRLGQALNSVVRQQRGDLDELGVGAFPSRVGDKVLRELMDGVDCDDIAVDLGIGGGRPVILTSTKGLAAPAGTMRSRELLPDAEAFLSQWAKLVEGLHTQVIVTIDPLPDFFFAMQHASANAAVSAMPWDAVYEVSWADILDVVSRTIPQASCVAITTRGGFLGAETASPLVFGAGAEAASPGVLRQAILGTPQPVEDTRPSRLSELFEQECRRPDAEWLKDQLGLDSVTTTLLYDRFAEDIETIRRMPHVQLI